MSGRTNRVGSHPAHEVEMTTTAQAEAKKAEHEAALDLRMVQVGAVAVAREALRLAAEVAAGRANAAHVRAVMTGCLNIPEVNAQALLTEPPVSRAEVLREVLDALGAISFAYPSDTTAHPLGTLRMEFSGKGTHPVSVYNLSKNEMAHAERVARTAFDAARDIVSGMARKAVVPSVPRLEEWLRSYVCRVMGVPLAETESVDLNVLMERAQQHMDANPMPGSHDRSAQEKRAAFALAGPDLKKLRPDDLAGAQVSAWNETKGRLTLRLQDASAKALADVGAALMRYGLHLDVGSLKESERATRGLSDGGGQPVEVIERRTWTIEAQRS